MTSEAVADTTSRSGHSRRIIVMMGAPGAGKGTQAERLAEELGLPHVSTGELFRAMLKSDSELGRKVRGYMDSGGLVPDDIVVAMVEDRLAEDDAAGGVILDGFPRTVAQAEALDGITAEKPVNVAIDLDVPREIVLERISSRRVCRDCGTNYTASGDVSSPWICDVCGGDVQQRADDTPEAVNRRLDLYESQTAPLIEYYSSRGALAVVNGVGHPDHVFKRLTDVVEARR